MLIPVLGACVLVGCAGSVAGCAGPTGPDVPLAPWTQLEKYAGPGTEVVVWVDLDGSYKGHEVQTAFKGHLGADQVARLKQLFRDDLLAIYRTDALPADGTVSLEGSAELPIYRIVVRKESAAIHPGDERMAAYLPDKGAHRETEALLRETDAILDQAVRR